MLIRYFNTKLKNTIPFRYNFFTFYFLINIFYSCNEYKKTNSTTQKVIIITPFIDFNKIKAEQTVKYIRQFNSNVYLGKVVNFPKASYVKSRNRYRADSLIRYLKKLHAGDTITVGLTDFDISVSKNNIPDWGVMGLGFRPGKSCVISSFRLKKSKQNEQFQKVVLHEIGHTFGLDHCKTKSCLMRDAEGGNPLDEEIDFCKACTQYLAKNGFKKQNF
ncbi:MAG: matrixin family metalloprotease [Chitinophagaceae bacterium]